MASASSPRQARCARCVAPSQRRRPAGGSAWQAPRPPLLHWHPLLLQSLEGLALGSMGLQGPVPRCLFASGSALLNLDAHGNRLSGLLGDNFDDKLALRRLELDNVRPCPPGCLGCPAGCLGRTFGCLAGCLAAHYAAWPPGRMPG